MLQSTELCILKKFIKKCRKIKLIYQKPNSITVLISYILVAFFE